MEQVQEYKITVTWDKKNFDVTLNSTQKVTDFKAIMYSLTSVPVDKQKLMFNGKMLKDQDELKNLKLTSGAKIMMLGKSEQKIQELQQAQKQAMQEEKKIVFYEDMTPEQRAKAFNQNTGLVLPVGLVNLGNTCYMNSSIQCLRRVNELKKFLMDRKLPQINTPQVMVGKKFQELIVQLEKSGQAVQPLQFVHTFMHAYQQFAEKDKRSQAYKQQDADEFFQLLLGCLEQCTDYENEEGEKVNLIRELFQIEYQVTFQNQEIPEEQPEVKTDFSRKLMCNIDNQNNPVNQLTESITYSMQEQIEKKSQIDNANHIYNKTSKISKLPSYLAVQMVRFYWKTIQQFNEETGTKTKILRNVGFPKVLDLYPYCTDELKKSLDKGKEYEKMMIEQRHKVSENKFEEYKKKLEQEGKMVVEDTKQLYKAFKEEEEKQQLKEFDQTLYRQHGTGLDTGNYQLVAVLTHQGRSAEEGHYIGWTHQTGDTWVQYDDDKTSEKKVDQILELRGGGDWHMSYYLIYRKLEIQ